MNRKMFSILTLAFALMAGAVLTPAMASSFAPCNPKDDPGCGNSPSSMEAPCNPKVDPGCSN